MSTTCLEGQVVRGQVTEAASGDPIAGVVVTLSDWTGVVAYALTGPEGRYELAAPQAGPITLQAIAMGYGEAGGTFWVPADEPVLADVELLVVPIPLDPIEVTVEARVPHLAVVGFYDRLEEGHGHYIIREQIDRRSAKHVTDLLVGLPGVRVAQTDNVGLYEVIMRGGASREFAGFPGRRSGGRQRTQFCLPSITIDGTMVRRGGRGYAGEEGRWNELVPPSEIEAIEVYPGAAGLPPEVAGSDSPCGAILIWTRR